MKMNGLVAFLIVGAVAFSGLAFAQSDTEKEVKQTIVENWEYANVNLKERPDQYSKHGALSFWSSGGLLNKVGSSDKPDEYDIFNVHPKHIKVITLVEGQAATALYYLEGSRKLKSGQLVSNYLVRVTSVFVKEDGKWKWRSAHASPLAGGAGMSATAPQ